MIDARIATNLLLVLRPEIERAQALLEAAQALQEIARGLTVVPAASTEQQGKAATQFLSEQDGTAH